MSDIFPANSRRTTSSFKQELFPAKQRGFYSDILREEAAGELQVGGASDWLDVVNRFYCVKQYYVALLYIIFCGYNGLIFSASMKQ